MTEKLTLERTWQATLQEVWELWTTKEGIEAWWGPEGFAVTVREMDLRAGGQMRYAMTAVGEGQIAFMKSAGMPLSQEVTITFNEVSAPRRLSFSTLADFIPGVKPYPVETVVELTASGKSVKMVLRFDAMHDAVWTERSRMGEEMQLRKLDALLAQRATSRSP